MEKKSEFSAGPGPDAQYTTPDNIKHTSGRKRSVFVSRPDRRDD